VHGDRLWCYSPGVPDLPPLLRLLLLGTVGAVVGSFVNLVALRWPAGEPIALARSACRGCGATLTPGELIPLVSFAVQGGRCRQCGSGIAWRYPAVELAAAAVGCIAAATVPWPAASVVAALGWALLLLVLLDAEHFWLPSAVTWPLTAAGLLATGWLVPAEVPGHVIGAAVGYVSLTLVAVLYRHLRGRDGLGGGDPKLFAAAGAWLGWTALPTVLGAAAVSGLLTGLLLWGRGITGTTRLPFGVFLAPAIWITALATFS